jgi:hypothetical protein
MGEVLTWHLQLCEGCPVDRCLEYWEIVEEYGEYERNYAWKGNP